MISFFYNYKNYPLQNIENFFCICTDKIEPSDLIGCQKVAEKLQKTEEMIVWKDGFLTKAVILGLSVILDNIEEAPSTVTERLNGLLDKNYGEKDQYFDIPENPKNNSIKINQNFRLICTCNINKVNKMSPAFINRFDVIVLEDQLEEIKDNDLLELIATRLIIENEKKLNNNKPILIDDDNDSLGNYDEYNSDDEEDNISQKDINLNEVPKSDKDLCQDISQHKNINDIEKDKIIKVDDVKINFKEEENNNEYSKPISQKEINQKLDQKKKEILNIKKDYLLKIKNAIKNIKKEDFNIFNLSKFIRAVDIFINILNSSKDIKEEAIINFTFNLIFSKEKEIDKIIFDKEIMNFFLNKLLNVEIPKNHEQKYFFKESNSLKKFMVFMLAASYINLHMCVIGPPGGGKTTSAKAFSRIRGKLLNINAFKIHNFNEGTKPNNFYGISTLIKQKIVFKKETLTEAIEQGCVFIADEFNLSPISTMKSIAPTLELFFNEKLIIPGTEGIFSINNNFFLIICQNDSNILGRNQIPPEIKTKLRIINYSKPELKEIKEICKEINRDLNHKQNVIYNEEKDDDDAEKIGEFMIKLNDMKQIILPKWSFRDVNKLLLRLINMKKNDFNYNGIETSVAVLFYAMSSVSSENESRIIKKLIGLIVNVFHSNLDDSMKNQKIKQIHDIYESIPYLEYNTIEEEIDCTEEKEKENIKKTLVYIRKGKCKIYYKTIETKTNNNIDDEEKINLIKIFKKLPSFLNTLFKVSLSNDEEPLLLSGNTCYKTFLADEYLGHYASIVSLNQETSIEQLLGSSKLFDKNEAKEFYLTQLCNCTQYKNLPELLFILRQWLNKENNNFENIEEKVKLKTKIDEFIENPLKESPFKIAIKNLNEKLFNEQNKDNSLISGMVIEFRPGLFLSAILGKKSLILKNFPNAKTVVLERFNELFSGQHTITLNEDIHQTFTDSDNREIINFNNSFRIIATCQKGYEKRLSEALLSRFTVISVQPYSNEEQKQVLYLKIKNTSITEENINKLNIYSEKFSLYFKLKFPLPKMITCLNICNQINKKIQNNKNQNLFLSFYILAKGILEKRDKDNINSLRAIYENENFIGDLENKSCPLEISKNNKDYLESIFSKIAIYSNNLKIPNNINEICFTQKCIELLDVLHFGISTKTPIILEGIPDQGKQTMIKFLADFLNFELININISSQTTNEDLLGKMTIGKNNKGQIIIRNSETKLLLAIKCYQNEPNTIVVFQNLNHASPAVMETLSSIFGSVNSNILLPDGSMVKKGIMNIIGIFNRQGGANRDKLPTNLLYNSIYHIVESPNDQDIKDIIEVLFKVNNLSNDERKTFTNYFFRAKNFSSKIVNEISLSLTDIKKYIDFRIKCPNLKPYIINQFIFVYRFTQEKNIEDIIKKLDFGKFKFEPEIHYKKNNTKLNIRLSSEKESNEFDILTYDTIEENNAFKFEQKFEELTMNEKYCLLFLICSVLSKRTCLLQGETCSGKSYLVKFLADILGQKLIIYQMNSDVGMSIYSGDKVINEELKAEDINELSNIIEKIKNFIDFDYNDPLNISQYKNILYKIEEKLSNNKEKNNIDIKNLLLECKKKISLIISPVNQFRHQNSEFINALKYGYWVLFDGIDLAPKEIIEKLVNLSGDNRELNIYESGDSLNGSNTNENFDDNRELNVIKSGDGIYFNDRNINEKFHLFLTCNPYSDGTKKIDRALFSKCNVFTSPQIDSTPLDAALILYSSINFNDEAKKSIIAKLSARIANMYYYCKEESKKCPELFAGGVPFTPRNLIFDSNVFRYSCVDSSLENIILSLMEHNYFNSFNNNYKQKKENFINKCKEILYKKPNFDIVLKGDIKDKLFNILYEIKKAQEIIINNDLLMKFDLFNFVQECLNLKLVKKDLTYIKDNIEDTLDIYKLLNSKSSQRSYILQLKIILNILTDIVSKFNKIDSKDYNTEFNSNEIDKIEIIKEPLLRLHLLSKLMIGKDNINLFNHNIKPDLFNDKLKEILIHIKDFIEDQNAITFEKLIISFFQKEEKDNNNKFEILNKNYDEIFNIINELFPYNNENITSFSKKLLSVLIILNKKKINFNIFINKNTFKFIYNKTQNDKLNGDLYLDKNNFYFSQKTKIYKKI